MRVQFTNKEILTFLKLIDESNYTTVSLKVGDFVLTASKGNDTSLVDNELISGIEVALNSETITSESVNDKRDATKLPSSKAVDDSNEIYTVTAPMVGTFYRASSPGEEPFIHEGNWVNSDDTVGLVEVMKLFNSVSAGVSGRVIRFLVQDGAPVEYGQPLVQISRQQAGKDV